jgi:hypothetical protein
MVTRSGRVGTLALEKEFLTLSSNHCTEMTSTYQMGTLESPAYQGETEAQLVQILPKQHCQGSRSELRTPAT